MNMETRQRARILVADLLKSRGDDGQLADSESLLLSGRLQSLDAVTIAVFLEREYAIDFSVVGFDQTQIDSVDEIVRLVERDRRD